MLLQARVSDLYSGICGLGFRVCASKGSPMSSPPGEPWASHPGGILASSAVRATILLVNTFI